MVTDPMAAASAAEDPDTSEKIIVATTTTIANPHLWSPDSPYLYQVLTEVRDGDRLADTYTSPLGFRWYRWDRTESRLYLNGKQILSTADVGGAPVAYQIQ